MQSEPSRALGPARGDCAHDRSRTGSGV